MKKNKAKLNLPGTTKTNNGTIPESPLSKDGLNNRRRMPPVNYGESEDEDIMPKDDESGDEATTNPQNESMSPSSRLIECPKPQCFKKFRDLDALKYHLSYTHNDLKEDKPINKKLKKKKKLLAKRKREANAKGCTEKIEIKKETETNFLESSSKLYMNDSKIKTEVKLEENDMSRHSSMKIYQALNGSDGRSLENVKSEQFSKSSANHSSSYPVYGSSSNPQPLALTSSSSGISQKSDNFNSQTLSAGSSISKGLNSQHNINYLMSNHQQERLNFEGSKGHVSNQPPPAHGGNNHLHPAQSNLLQNGSRTSMSMAKELDGRLSSLAQNGSNEHRSTGYQPLNLGSSKDHWASKSQNPNHGPLQKQRSSGGPASPAYSDISDEESTTASNNMAAITGNGNNSNNKTGSSRGLPLGPYQSTSQSRSADQDQARKSTMSLDAPRSTSNQLNSASDRKTDGTKPTTQTIGPPPSHLPPELHGGSLAFPPHLSAGIPGLPPGFPPHLVASLAASMGAASAGAGHRFPSPMPPIPGLPGSSNPNVKALDILQQHANQYIATSKLQELQDRAGQGKSTGAVNSSSTSSPLSVPKSTSPSMSHLLGLNRGNVASSSPPLLRHEHNHTHVHLGYPPPGLPPSGLSGPASGSSSSLLGAASNAALGSSLRGVAPPAGSIAVPGAPPTSHLPPPSPSSIMSGKCGCTILFLIESIIALESLYKYYHISCYYQIFL